MSTVKILTLYWILLFHFGGASSQYFDSDSASNNGNIRRKSQQEPYDIFNNRTIDRASGTGPGPGPGPGHEFQAKYVKEYDSNLNNNNINGDLNGRFFSNSTHRIRGNVTEFYDPKYYGDGGGGSSSQQGRSQGGSDPTNRRLQNYYANRNQQQGNNPNYNADSSAYDANVNHPDRGSEYKSYEERVTGGSGSFERENGGRIRSEDYSATYRNNPNSNQNQQNTHSASYDSANKNSNLNYPGSSSGSGSYFDRNSNYDKDGNRQYQSDSNQNYPRQDDGRGRTFTGVPDQGNSFSNNFYPGGGGSGSGGNPNYNPYPYPNQNQGQRGVFDPGYPNKNIWDEHWSTTTDRPRAPGVLGKWRPDLQGQQRPEDIHTVPPPVYVTTSYGRVQGFKVKLYDGPWVPLPARPGITNVDKTKQTVSSFVGIPYARPPTQEGRFKPPRPHTGWQLLQAVDYGPACPQPSRFFGFSAGIVQVDEDCLFLNVFSPDVGSGAKSAPYPVIFYIHDGDFTYGASQQFPPHQLVAWYDLVVVTVNFRLGAIGFLSTADEFSPGNYGMLDLSLALKWVHTNIRAFNGDPDRITLVGLGSGAAAAGLLMLSPRSRTFVKNVVALEGAPTADWAAITDKYRLQNTTELFSRKLGCWQQYEQSSWKTIQCLKSRSWRELANLELEPDVGIFPWAPAVDKEFLLPKDDYVNDWKEEDWRFLPDDPIKLLKRGDYPYVKYMTGFSRQSAADLLYANKTLAPNYVVTREWMDMMIHRWVKKYNYTLNPEGVYEAIRYAYTYWPDPHNSTHVREEYINFLSDALYRAPVDQTVKLLLARGIQVHQYLLNYTLEGLRLPFWREVPRGLEYYLLSGAPFMDPEFYPERLRVDRSAWTEGDRNMSNFFMSAVANMAHFGTPTRQEILGIYWERATPADMKYLSLNGTNNSSMQRNYGQRELTFWSEYMPSVVGRYVPTYPPVTEHWWEPTRAMSIAFWSVCGVCLIMMVVLVACCLLWRTAKKQRDRIYDDLGLANGPLGIGTIVGDEISEYAETVKTADSMDSGVKLTTHHPNPSSQNSTNIALHHRYPTPPQVHSSGRDMGLHGGTRGDRYPTPRRNIRDRDRDNPQTQV